MNIRSTGAGRLLGALLAAFALGQAARAETLQDLCGDCRFEKFVTCGEFLEGVNVDRDGVMWAVSLFSGDIIRIADGKCAVVAKTGGKPNGSRFANDGRLFITDNIRGIITFDTRTFAITPFADKAEGQPILNANDLIFDQKGGFYVTEVRDSSALTRTGRLLYFPPGSTEARVIARDLPYPNGVALSPDGMYVDVGLYAQKAIITLPSVLNPSNLRGPYTNLLTQGGIGPDGMMRDAKGRLLWAEFLSGSVGVTDDAGFPLGYIRLPPEAGRWTTNITLHDGYLYVTEAQKGEVWRTRFASAPADVAGLR